MRFIVGIASSSRVRMAVRLAFVLGVVPIVMAARCNPTPPSEGSGSCTALTCPGNQIPACLNFCAPLPPPAQVRNAPCAMDPCNRAAIRTGAFLCPDNFVCTTYPLAPVGIGRCQAGAGPLQGCNPIAGVEVCSTNTYCRTFDASFPRPPAFPTRFAGLCSVPIREDGRCDSDLNGGGRLQCEAGTNCIHHGPGLGYCERPCQAESDCSCTTATVEHICPSAGGTCRLCDHNRETCDLAADPVCCDVAATCQQVGARAECCHADTVACANEGECCDGHRCGTDFGHASDGCFACAPAGTAPRYGARLACCAGSDLNPATGLCARTCVDTRGISRVEGTACTPLGICTTAEWECPAPGEPSTARARCHQDGAMPAEICNGLDDDCDGPSDEDTTNLPCMGPADDFICPNFTPTAIGSSTCRDGVPGCAYRADQWCGLANIDDTLQEHLGPGGCLVANGEVCTDPGVYCSPGEACGPLPGQTCDCTPGQTRFPGCGCRLINGVDSGVHVCRVLGEEVPQEITSGEPICWNPGDRRGPM